MTELEHVLAILDNAGQRSPEHGDLQTPPGLCWKCEAQPWTTNVELCQSCHHDLQNPDYIADLNPTNDLERLLDRTARRLYDDTIPESDAANYAVVAGATFHGYALRRPIRNE